MSYNLYFVAALMAATPTTDLEARTDSPFLLGRPATANEIAGWNIDVSPDGRGLPPGQGDATTGQWAYAQWCSACHGDSGGGGSGPQLAGGTGGLATAHPIKTAGSYWPYSTTLFDYTRRAMPLYALQSLSTDQIYSITAYILFLNGLVARESTLDATSLPQISMPNRDGFVSGDGPMINTCVDATRRH